MVRADAAALIVLAAALVLAGCLAGPGAGPSANGTDGGGDGSQPEDQGSPGGSGPLDVSSAAFSFPGNATDVVRWKNGSFQPQEACFPAGCFASFVTGDRTAEQRLDLSEEVPPGTPTRISLNLTWDPNDASVFQPFYLSLSTDDTRILRQRRAAAPGEPYYRLDAVVVRDPGGSVGAAVQYNLPEPEVDKTYALRAAVTADPRVVPTDAPVALPVPEGAEKLRLVPANGTVRAMLWGPNDTYLGPIEIEAAPYEVPLPGAEGGTYVLYLLAPSGGVTVVSPTAPVGNLSVLDTTTTESGPKGRPLPDQPVEWTFDRDRVPLGVGIWLGDGTARWYSSWEGSGSIASPDGTVFRFANSGLQGGSRTAITDLGDLDLTTGTYEATFSATAYQGQVGHVVVDYVRPG